MLFFSPVPLQLSPAQPAAPAFTGLKDGGQEAPSPPLRSVLERAIDVWTAAYTAGVAPSF